MEIFQVALMIATFLCSLVAGFLLGFAIVTMPGFSNLTDREFIRAFQVIDRVIQNNQPIFILVWVGSAITLVIAAVLSIGQLDTVNGLLMIIAVLIYLPGVQLPTIRINIPLNNQLQTLDVDTMDETAHKAAREAFEPRWNQWNVIRTIAAGLNSALLIVLVSRV